MRSDGKLSGAVACVPSRLLSGLRALSHVHPRGSMAAGTAGEFRLLALLGKLLAESLFSIALVCWVLSSWSWYALIELIPALVLDGAFTGAMLYYTLGAVIARRAFGGEELGREHDEERAPK